MAPFEHPPSMAPAKPALEQALGLKGPGALLCVDLLRRTSGRESP
jgi:hypothetical protein